MEVYRSYVVWIGQATRPVNFAELNVNGEYFPAPWTGCAEVGCLSNRCAAVVIPLSVSASLRAPEVARTW